MARYCSRGRHCTCRHKAWHFLGAATSSARKRALFEKGPKMEESPHLFGEFSEKLEDFLDRFGIHSHLTHWTDLWWRYQAAKNLGIWTSHNRGDVYPSVTWRLKISMKIVYLPHNVPLCDAMAAKVHVHLVSSVTLLHHNLIPTVDFLPAETPKWVCLKIGYIPNYSHLIGIMISKTIGFRGTQHFQTHPNGWLEMGKIQCFQGTPSSHLSVWMEHLQGTDIASCLVTWWLYLHCFVENV